jgi:general secretion pathway protein D
VPGLSSTNTLAGTNSVSGTNGAAGVPVEVSSVGSFGDKGFTPNLRGASIEAVLNYMSDAAGFVILLQTSVSGTIDLWSKQPVSRDEMVVLLNTVLAKNGYAAIQNGKILSIVTRDEARRGDVPIISGNIPANIPKDDKVVTQILSVRSLNATQLAKDLAQLLPTDVSMVPNEAGNSLIMTDTQSTIRRVAELIRALDAAGTSANSIKTYTLKYADAKSLVSIIKELFPSSSSSSSGNQGGFGRMNPMAMFGGGPGGNRGGSGDNSSQKASTRVSVVSDDTSNMLVVSAPDDIIPLITDLVDKLDVKTEDEAEIRLFPLKNADPSEMAELLTSLFPDDTSSSSGNNRNSGPFGFFGGPGGGMNRSSSSSTSDRLKRKNKVIAVAEPRTRSVAVTADKSIMEQIEPLITQLDSNPSRKMKVFVYSLQNADVTDVETVLSDLFQSSTSSRSSSSSSSSTTNPFTTRKTTMYQQQSSTSSSFSNSSSNSQ